MAAPTRAELAAALDQAERELAESRTYAASTQAWADEAANRANALTDERDWLRALVDRMTQPPTTDDENP